jgi:putative membrane protein insertion efficiency factor
MTGGGGGLSKATARTVIYVIQLYRHMVSPLRPATCRFMPTCSQYAVDALTEYGLVRGGWLAAVRLAKCGPWYPGGWDPIPERHPGGIGSREAGDLGIGSREAGDLQCNAGDDVEATDGSKTRV